MQFYSIFFIYACLQIPSVLMLLLILPRIALSEVDYILLHSMSVARFIAFLMKTKEFVLHFKFIFSSYSKLYISGIYVTYEQNNETDSNLCSFNNFSENVG